MRKFLRRNLPLLLVLCILTGLIAVACARNRAALPTGSWGLSFPQEGQPPTGNTSNERLQECGAAYLGDTTQKVIYLTFDAGYENGCTAPILDALAKHNARAAFFVVGNYLEQNPELVRRMVREGHIVGNHTYHHYDMSKLSDETSFNEELTSLEALYREVTGLDMEKYYRPPQGIYSEQNLEYAQRAGYHTIFWSLAYVDWKTDDQPDPQEAIELLNRRVHPGAVILLHSTSETNCEILQELIRGWKAQGYTFATLDDLCAGE